MQIKLFTISASDSGTLQEELNHFLSNRRILEVEQKFCENDRGGVWSFCVRYLGENERVKLPAVQQNFVKKEKPDYKEILNEQQYNSFLQFKAARKEISALDGVLPYNVFTDAELVEIVRLDVKDEKNVSKINGIGEKRAQKYWKKVLEKTIETAAKRKEEEKDKPNEEAKPNETSGLFN
ncbi:MAG: HRDC domain-containing protein [Chitinispirillales bacterium]|jgi:superfamily II DNA helicase RecQ|nr:HRDC domain-containing protein [Chitinispirillales bacterium]